MKKQWWHKSIAYQIYPKSFMDSNGDGVGDLQGIISKLDYLKDLGIDLVWLSPVYKSPFVDQGYDIADYYSIDPLFGSMEDMEELLQEAKKRNIGILMDLVANHCSSEHEWFQKALKDPLGEYGKYFIIRKGKDGKAPNNWRSYFGGSVWEPIPGTDLYYLHFFAKEQPDLNWENPKVRQEIYKNINWWLKKGLAGFRIDAIVNIKKDLSLGDLPPDGEDGLADCGRIFPHVTGLLDFLKELKEETFARHSAFTVAELFDDDEARLKEYIGEEGVFSSIFDFSTHLLDHHKKGWYDRPRITPNAFRDTIFSQAALTHGTGYLCNIIENHDEPRGASRYLPKNSGTKGRKALAAVFMMREGLPFLYQGQEIGMVNSRWEDIGEINDISTLDQYRLAKEQGFSEARALQMVEDFSRDNARTPMQWSSRENAGFSKAKPWLKVNPDYRETNVEDEERDPDSVLWFYKKLIRIRKDEKYAETLVYAPMEPVYQDRDNVIGFYRRGDATILVLANMQDREVRLASPGRIKEILANTDKELQREGDNIVLHPFQALVAEL